MGASRKVADGSMTMFLGLGNPFLVSDFMSDAPGALHGVGLEPHGPQVPLKVIFHISIWVSTVWFMGSLKLILKPDLM